MGISFFTNLPDNMVAAQVYIALCVAGVAVAAPQLDFGGLRSVATTREVAPSNVNEADVVSNVVSALQPSIAKAVADALAGLQTSTLTPTSSQSSSSLSAANAAAAAAEEATSLAADVGPVVKPEYNFEYKVADADAQTYITQSENRDGDTLTGMYSYVNPDGALITVNYEAGPMGYSQTLDQQDGFISINPQPIKAAVATSSTSSASGSSSSSSSEFSGATSTASNAGFSSSSSSSSSLDQSALIAQIISALQPQISSAVQSAISSSSSRTVVAPAPAAAYPPRARLAPVAPVAAASGDLAGTFGSGFSVKIDTPEFNIAY